MKILMVLMGLNIGGAETHVVELSKELARRKNDITVASSGGVYVKELEKAGIRHVQLPLGSRHIYKMLKSLIGLYRFIKPEISMWCTPTQEFRHFLRSDKKTCFL